MKVCYFGIYKEDFTRTKVIIKALESQNIEVIRCVDRTPSLKKYLNLIRGHRKIKDDYDVMLVGFPGYFVMFLARLLTNKPIIFDAYISYYDGLLDRRNYFHLHPKTLMARLVDWAAVMCSDVTLTINAAYKDFFVNFLHVPENKIEVLHKGADESIFYPKSSKKISDKRIVVWWGNYIPLHGIKYIVEAASLLRNEKNIEFHLIGRGQMKFKMIKLVENLKLENVKFLDPKFGEDLTTEIANADIALGIFSPAPKALRCVTNKVFEAMAMGMAIVTEESPANSEIFTHKENAYLVPPGDAPALSSAIIELLSDVSLKEKISKNVLTTFQGRFSNKMISREFLDIISRHKL
jgi:glycosyltransferase involved in cell wall biosynthesis